MDSNELPNNSTLVSHFNLNHPEDPLIQPDIKPYEGDTSLNQRSPSTSSNLISQSAEVDIDKDLLGIF